MQAARGDGLDVTIVDESHAVQIDDVQVRRLCFDLGDVDRFVAIGLFRRGRRRLFHRTDDVQRMQRREKPVDTTHESLEKDHLGQADAQTLEIAREFVQIVEIVQLHGGREVEREILQIGTVVGEHA